MNKKGQVSFFGAIVLLLCFLALWIFWLAGFLRSQVSAAIAAGTLSGLEAFLFANINLWIGIILVIAFFYLLSMGGGQ